MFNKYGKLIEDTYLDKMFSESPEDLITARVRNLLEWYLIVAQRKKCWFYFFSIISIIIPVAIGLLSGMPQNAPGNSLNILCLISILSGILVIINALAALFNLKDDWKRYRTTAERIKSEMTLFLKKVPPYDKETNSDKLFIINLEEIVQNENNSWKKFFDDKEKDLKS